MRAPVAVVAVLSAACVPTPPAPPAPHTAIEVNASFGRTWDSLIDQFAAQNIPIKTIDRTSGLIATDALKVGLTVADASDCGKDYLRAQTYATDATYNALVRGDSAKSTLRITVRWVRIGKSRMMGTDAIVSEECSTRGTWETDLERRIKEAAENKR